MKKIFALALAIVMMMAIALPVFADWSAVPADSDAVTHFSDTVPAAEKYETFDNMYIKYGVQQEYIVTIPADVTFTLNDLNSDDVFEITRNVSATNIVISGNEVFAISVVSDSDWKMVDQDAGKSTPVDYTATLADNPMTATANDPVAYNNANHDDAVVEYVLIIDPAEGNTGWQNKAYDDVNIVFTTNGTAQEGTFLDTLTFTVEIFEGAENDPRA